MAILGVMGGRRRVAGVPDGGSQGPDWVGRRQLGARHGQQGPDQGRGTWGKMVGVGEPKGGIPDRGWGFRQGMGFQSGMGFQTRDGFQTWGGVPDRGGILDIGRVPDMG